MATSTTITDDSVNGPVAVKPPSTAAVATDPALVVAISPNNPISVSGTADATATGALGALNATVQVTTAGLSSVGFQLAAGTLIGTIVPEVSFDGGTTWVSTYFDDPSTPAKSSSIVFGSNNTATARTIIGVGGSGLTRVRVSAYTSGTANITLRASLVRDPSSLHSGSAGTPPPPSVEQVGGSDGTNLQAIRVETDGNVSASRTASGSITLISTGVTLSVLGMASAGVQITGTWSATIAFQGTMDGSNWFTVLATAVASTAGASPVTSTAANGQWLISTSGLASVRVFATAFTSGTVVATLIGSPHSSVMQQIRPAVTITGPAAGAAALYALPTAYGTLRTSGEPSALFNDTFEGDFIDTANRWNVTQVLSGTVVQTGGNLTISTGTTAGAGGALTSKPYIPATGLSFQWYGFTVAVDASTVTGAHRFWGVGTPGATAFTALTPLDDGIGFEVDVDGLMYACIYASGTAIFKQVLTKPTDGLQHRYGVITRADATIWYLENIDLPVASVSYKVPTHFTLPLRLHLINDVSSPPGSSPLLTSLALGAGDTATTSVALSDGTYSWRKVSVDEDGFLSTTALAHGRSDVTQRTTITDATASGIDEFTGTYSNGRFVQLVKDNSVATALAAIQAELALALDLLDTSRPKDVKLASVNRSITKSVVSSATNVLILDLNTNRKGATVYNDSTQVLYLNLDDTQTSITNFTVKLLANAYYELPFDYTGQVSGIWAAANGSARITEFFY